MAHRHILAFLTHPTHLTADLVIEGIKGSLLNENENSEKLQSFKFRIQNTVGTASFSENNSQKVNWPLGFLVT